MSDYYLDITVQHGRLRELMREQGIETGAELSRISGVGANTISKILNFKLSPVLKNKEWRPDTLRICSALGARPDDVFPDELRHEIPTNKIQVFVNKAQRDQLTSDIPLQYIECHNNETREIVAEVLETIAPRERYVLEEFYYAGRTYTDIGRDLGVTGTRVKQLRDRALKRLRYTERLERLEEVV